MNVWLVNHYAIPPGQSGGTRHFILARELVERGHRVTIVASSFDHTTRLEMHLRDGAPLKLEVVDGVRFLWLKTPPYKGNSVHRLWNTLVFARKVLGLRAADLGGPPDVVLGSSPHLFAAAAAERLARRHRVPFVLEVRDLWPQSLVDLGSFSQGHPFVRLLEGIERRLYRRAHRIITLLPGAAEHIAQKGGDPERIVWIPNGVDIRLLPAPTPPTPSDIFTYLYAGAHGLANHLDYVLEAARLVEEQHPEFPLRFRFVGDGPEKAGLIKRAQELMLKNVTFESPVPKAQIFELMVTADAFTIVVQNSPLYRWGISPNKLYDYLAMARPIVLAAPNLVFNNPVEEAGAGLTAPSDDVRAFARAIVDLARLSPEERWQMGLRGRDYVERHHNVARLADRLEHLLTEAARAAPPRSRS